MSHSSGECSRRDFMKTSATAVASLSAFTLGLPNRAYAAGSDRIRIGLVGCGGRGTDAAINCLEADDGVELVAMADAFQDRLKSSQEKIRQWCEKTRHACCSEGQDHPRHDIPGLQGLQEPAGPACRGCRSDRDAGLFPSGAPGGGDPGGQARVHGKAGCRGPARDAQDHRGRGVGQAEGAGDRGGTQRRHQAKYRQNAYALAQGAIGRIVGGRVWWCGGGDSNPPLREPGQSDAEYMVRNWYRLQPDVRRPHCGAARPQSGCRQLVHRPAAGAGPGLRRAGHAGRAATNTTSSVSIWTTAMT